MQPESELAEAARRVTEAEKRLKEFKADNLGDNGATYEALNRVLAETIAAHRSLLPKEPHSRSFGAGIRILTSRTQLEHPHSYVSALTARMHHDFFLHLVH